MDKISFINKIKVLIIALIIMGSRCYPQSQSDDTRFHSEFTIGYDPITFRVAHYLGGGTTPSHNSVKNETPIPGFQFSGTATYRLIEVIHLKAGLKVATKGYTSDVFTRIIYTKYGTVSFTYNDQYKNTFVFMGAPISAEYTHTLTSKTSLEFEGGAALYFYNLVYQRNLHNKSDNVRYRSPFNYSLFCVGGITYHFKDGSSLTFCPEYEQIMKSVQDASAVDWRNYDLNLYSYGIGLRMRF